MKSDVCYIKKKSSLDEAFAETEKAAEYCGLGKKERLQLRLLAEETTGMIRETIGACRAAYWVETKAVDYKVKYWEEVKTIEVSLHLKLEMNLSEENRKKLISVSSTGKKEAPGGFMGKIRAFFEACMDNYEESGEYCSENDKYRPYMGEMYQACSRNEGSLTWTLQNYAGRENEKEHPAEWDELEKSIVAKLADDVVVSIHKKQTEIIVIKIFNR